MTRLDNNGPPLASRPRPPRSRSGRLASSQSSSKGASSSISALDNFQPPEDCKPSTSAGPNAAHLMLIGALETLTPPATPPLATTSSMEALENLNKSTDTSEKACNMHEHDMKDAFPITQIQRENNQQVTRSPEELESMLAKARGIIEERETELGIAASIGKSLLDSNIALRARQDALLRRVEEHSAFDPFNNVIAASSSTGSFVDIMGKQQASQSQIEPFPNLHIPKAYGAHGEYVEGLPPPSPRQSLGRANSRSSLDLTGNIPTLSTHKRTASNTSTSSQRSLPPVSPPVRASTLQRIESPLRRSQGHHRRSSSSSTLNLADATAGFTSLSRSSSTKSIAELHSANIAQQMQLSYDIQRLRLSEQNAELESRLQDLECEVSRADATGKKKLRRLDRELTGLKKELESALERNKELEEKFDRRQSLKGPGALFSVCEEAGRSYSLPKVRVRTESGSSNQLTASNVAPQASMTSIPPDTDIDASEIDEVSRSNVNIEAVLDTWASSEARSSQEIAQDPEVGHLASGHIVAQLLAKINELQETNSHISARKEALNEQLTAASTQFDDMRRKYEFLEERVIEAEIRNHRILELEEGEPVPEDALLAIEWGQDPSGAFMSQRDSVSPATKIKRKAVGNRPRIEQYRRLSGLHASQAGSDLLLDPASAYTPRPRRGTFGPSNSRHVTPQRDASSTSQMMLPSISSTSRLSVSPARSIDSATSRTRSRAGSFFDTEAVEDIITTMQRKLRADREAFERDQTGCFTEEYGDDCHNEASEQPKRASNVYARLDPLPLASELLDAYSNPASSQLHDETPGGMYEVIDPAPTIGTHTPYNDDKLFKSRPLVHMSRSVSKFPLAGKDPVGNLERLEADEENLGSLLPDGPADAQSYDDLQNTLQDLAVNWEDDPISIRQGGAKRIEGPPATRLGRSSLPWTYEDEDSDNSDNDPWKEETNQHQTIESTAQVQAREKAEARALKRRTRMQELAQQMLEETESDSSQRFEEKLALVRAVSNQSDSVVNTSRHGASSSQDSSSDCEDSEIAKRTSGRTADYWPVSNKARYSPTIVAMRVQKTSQEYLGMCMLWTKFLAVLAVAVIFSIWRGPEAGLGVPRRRRKQLQTTEVAEGNNSVALRRQDTAEE